MGTRIYIACIPNHTAAEAWPPMSLAGYDNLISQVSVYSLQPCLFLFTKSVAMTSLLGLVHSL